MSSSQHVVVSQVEVPPEKTIDREKICPLLLRIFCAQGRHNSTSDYARGSVPPNELQIYTWLDCTLKELTSLIKDVNPDARRRGTEFNYAIVSPDRYSARYIMREVGITISGQRAADDDKTLNECKFEVAGCARKCRWTWQWGWWAVWCWTSSFGRRSWRARPTWRALWALIVVEILILIFILTRKSTP